MTAAPFDERYQEWQAPPWDAKESRKIGWVNEACQQGESWNKSQRSYDSWLKGLDIISGNCDDKELLEYRSALTGNRLKTNIQVKVAGLSAIRPWGGFQATKAYKNEALMINQVSRALYLNGFWDQSIKAALQWAEVCGTGWIRPVYRRNMAGHGHGNIELDTFGMPSTLFVQMPSNGDFQRAYACTLLDEKPVWEAHGMFPDFQDRLRPTSSRYWYNAQIRRASQENNQRRWGWNPFARKDRTDVSDHLIPFRYTTINDLAVNMTGKTMVMGQSGSPWAYEVPAYGEEMPDGYGGVRTADSNDARMYPYRRLIISSETCVPYDGPAFNWHGELDLIDFCLDKWPWEPTGFSGVHDGYRLQKAIDQIDRGTMDKINADMDRPLAYNMNAVEKRQADQVDLMQPRQRVAYDGDAVDKPFTTIAPDDVYKISAQSLEFRKELQGDLDYITQSRDIVELSKARALGKGMDQLEALVSANGPLVKDKSRSMEKSVSRLANQVKYLILEYMDTGRLIAYMDEENKPRVFDFDPSSLVPSHMPGEPVEDAIGRPIRSIVSQVKRARWWAQNLVFTLTPHSIHEIHQMTYRLMLMQLRQRGFHIAECDILEANDIPDVERADGSTTQERFWAEKFRELEHMVELQKKGQGLGIDIGQMLGAAGGKSPEGRPPSAQAAPQLKHKGDGRPVVTESK